MIKQTNNVVLFKNIINGQQMNYYQQNQKKIIPQQQSHHHMKIYQQQQNHNPNKQIKYVQQINQNIKKEALNKKLEIKDIPGFKLIKKGKGIDDKEYYVITHCANECLKLKEDPLSKGIVKKIKQKLKGEWMVVSCVEGLKGFDFTLSIVTGNDFLSFVIKNFLFQVCRIRN